MDLEGRLAVHLPAGDFIKRGLAERALPQLFAVALPSCVVVSLRPTQTSEIHSRLFPGVLEDTLHLMPSGDLSTGHFAACSGNQSITNACQFSFPSSSLACLLPEKLSQNLMGLRDAVTKN